MVPRRLDAARIYLLFAAADGLIRSLLFTFLSVYFVTRAGMDPLQLVLVGTVVEGTILLFEVPTGCLAERCDLACGLSEKEAMMFRNVLVGVDGGPNGRDAIALPPV